MDEQQNNEFAVSTMLCKERNNRLSESEFGDKGTASQSHVPLTGTFFPKAHEQLTRIFVTKEKGNFNDVWSHTPRESKINCHQGIRAGASAGSGPVCRKKRAQDMFAGAMINALD